MVAPSLVSTKLNLEVSHPQSSHLNDGTDSSERDPRIIEVDLLHSAGHGDLLHRNSWDVSLRLADGEALLLKEILKSPQTPNLVVLSGCKTGTHAAGAVGLPHVFLARGTRWILTTVENVPDGDTRDSSNGSTTTAAQTILPPPSWPRRKRELQRMVRTGRCFGFGAGIDDAYSRLRRIYCAKFPNA